MVQRKLTMSGIVGENIRRARAALGWSQQALAERLAEVGEPWSRATIAQLELGKRGATVDDLVVLALALGVAPHVLLYPPAGVDVAVADDVLPGPDLAHWIWSPDLSPYTDPEHEPQTERSVWFASARVAEGMTDEEAKEMAEQMHRDGLSKATARAFRRSGIGVDGVPPTKETD